MTTHINNLLVPEKGSCPYIRAYLKQRPGADVDRFKAGFYNQDINDPNHYRLIQASLYCATAAPVGNRNIQFSISQFPPNDTSFGGRVTGWKSPNIPQSAYGYMYIGKYGVHTGSPTILETYDSAVSIGELIFSGQDYMSLSLTGEQAGDVYQCVITLEYLNWKWKA